jgi:hypothetical protein
MPKPGVKHKINFFFLYDIFVLNKLLSDVSNYFAALLVSY